MSNTFNFSPLAPFPTPAESFPVGVQFQIDGSSLGAPNPTNVNFSGLGITGTYDETTDTVNFEISGIGSGGGGSGPAGSNKEIQFNDNGSFGSVDAFQLDKNANTITVGSVVLGEYSVKGFDNPAGSGGSLSITGGAASTGDGPVGGSVSIVGGSSAGGAGGNVSMAGGQGISGGGSVSLLGGLTTGSLATPSSITVLADGDAIQLTGGQVSGGTFGSNISITAGNGSSIGGTVFINGGNNGSGIEVQSEDSSNLGKVRIFGANAPNSSGRNGGDVLIFGGVGDTGQSIGYLNITLLGSAPSIAPTDWTSSNVAPLALYRNGTTYKLYAYLGGGWRSVALS